MSISEIPFNNTLTSLARTLLGSSWSIWWISEGFSSCWLWSWNSTWEGTFKLRFNKGNKLLVKHYELNHQWSAVEPGYSNWLEVCSLYQHSRPPTWVLQTARCTETWQEKQFKNKIPRACSHIVTTKMIPVLLEKHFKWILTKSSARQDLIPSVSLQLVLYTLLHLCITWLSRWFSPDTSSEETSSLLHFPLCKHTTYLLHKFSNMYLWCQISPPNVALPHCIKTLHHNLQGQPSFSHADKCLTGGISPEGGEPIRHSANSSPLVTQQKSLR